MWTLRFFQTVFPFYRAEASPCIVIYNSQHFADVFYFTGAHLKALRYVGTRLLRINLEYGAYPA